MSQDLNHLVGSLAANPELMAKLREVANSLSLPLDTPPAPAESPEPHEAVSGEIAPAKARSAEGRQLLLALRPYLGDARRERLDKILNLLCLLDAAKATGLTGEFVDIFKKRGDSADVSS